MTTNHLNLTVHFDADYDGYLVRQASNAFYSSTIPSTRTKNGVTNPVHAYFDTKAEAIEQVRRLNVWAAKGGTINFIPYITPALFEAVADTKYGCAW